MATSTLDELTYRLSLIPCDNFSIKSFEIVKKTEKTVTIRTYYEVGLGFARSFYEGQYSQKSNQYIFYDTLEKAKRAAANIVSNQLAQCKDRVEELEQRLQEVCAHKEITGPFLGNKCVRCGFAVPNPDDYCNGG